MVNDPEHVMKENLRRLEKFMDADAFSRLEKLAGSSSPALINSSGVEPGNRTYILNTSSGQVPLNSAGEPWSVTQRFIRRLEHEGKLNYNSILIVIGFSGAELLVALAEKLGSEGRIFVIEPNPQIFAAMLFHCDLSGFDNIPADKLGFGISEHFEYGWDSLGEWMSSILIKQPSLVVTPELLKLFGAQYRNVIQKINDMLTLEKRNIATSRMFARIWHHNAMRNFMFNLEEPAISYLKNAFAAKTAIIIGAGPGLNELIPFVKEHQSDYVIICVGTALKCIVANGITPDFVIAVDGSPKVVPQFDTLIPEKSFFAGCLTVDQAILNKFSGRMFVFETDLLNGLRVWLKREGITHDRLKTAGTVTVSAVALAVYIGCSHVILTGVELSFPENGVTHAQGTGYENNRVCTDLTRVRGNWTDEVLTTTQFADYIKMMSDYFAYLDKLNPGLKIINATSSGALIDHAGAIKPEKLADISLPRVKINKYEYILSLRYGFNPGAWTLNLLPALEKLCVELNAVIAVSTPAMRLMQHNKDGEIDVKAILAPETVARLDLIDSALRDNHDAGMIVNDVTRPLYLELSNCDINNVRLFTEKTLTLYRAIHETAVTAHARFMEIISLIKNKDKSGE
ncbi:MAG: motility associated factor glycosyltransferase family protein [Victivallales bacterium]|nr:motility associated factor glycosyltransferase family protein [Victivallales bacterium]